MLKSLIGSLLLTGFFISCQPKSEQKEEIETEQTHLTATLAKDIFALPTHCLQVEYPNKLGQTIGSAADLKTPKALRPVFYGCYDWHSSVHGYWSIVKLMKQFPELDANGEVRQVLNAHITAENVAIEKAFFENEHNLAFERTYGWAWLFKLQEELHTWNDPDAKRWQAALQPLVDLLVARFKVYLPKQLYPIRTGQHDNTAFGLSLSLDYARTVGDKSFEEAIKEHGLRYFKQDINCNLAYEPSGNDFLSPCLEEAFLMSKLMDKQEYNAWLKTFMPVLFDKNFKLEPAAVKDRTDGKLIHLDGLNYSRAACFYGIAKQVPELQQLRLLAEKHIAYSIGNISAKDDYMGSHWLGTFALYALSEGERSVRR